VEGASGVKKCQRSDRGANKQERWHERRKQEGVTQWEMVKREGEEV